MYLPISSQAITVLFTLWITAGIDFDVTIYGYLDLRVLDHVGSSDSSKRIAGTVVRAWFLVEQPLEHPGIGRHTWSWINRCRVSLLPIEHSDTPEVHNAICYRSATHTNPLKRTDSLYLARMFPVCYIIPPMILFYFYLSFYLCFLFSRYLYIWVISINKIKKKYYLHDTFNPTLLFPLSFRNL